MNKEINVKINEIAKLKDFVHDAESFMSDIDVIKGHYVIDAKSVMGMFSLDLSKEVVVRINSEDENEIARFNELMVKYASGNTGN